MPGLRWDWGDTMTDRDKRCENCAAWEPTVGVTYGRCHRNPPWVVVLHEGNDWQHPLCLFTDFCLDWCRKEVEHDATE